MLVTCSILLLHIFFEPRIDHFYKTPNIFFQSAHNNVLTEDMVKILWAKRHPEMDIDPSFKKESFLFNFGEHFRDHNSPQNDIHNLKKDNNPSKSTTNQFEDVLNDLGSKIEIVDDRFTSEIEKFGLRPNNSDKEIKNTVKNQSLVSSLNLKPALSVKDVFKRIPTDVEMFSQVQPSHIPQVRITF